MKTKLFTTIVLAALSSMLLAQNTVFLKNGGAGDGTSADAPVGTLASAYTILGDAGGTVVICDDYELTANFVEPAHTGLVTITQVHNSVDYRGDTETKKTFYITSSGKRFVLNGPTKFENINIKGFGTTSSFILFIANYYPITMGEGIHCEGFLYTDLARSTSILGGYQSGQGTPVATDLDSHITIQSGKFLLVGFNRSIAGPYTGTANIDISGGEIVTLYGGSAAGTGGSLDLNISGGVFSGPIHASNFGGNMAAGSVNVVVSGGDFTNCPSITGGTNGVGATTTIDISGYSNQELLKSKIQTFNTIITSDGEITNFNPNDVFDFGSFTASDGTQILYRSWFPKNYDTSKKYPIALYLHGNGSIGNDNTTHLTTSGAAYVHKVLNSGTDCIILAPQSAVNPAWVGPYPGSASYTVENTPMRGTLSAAKELLDSIVENASVDKNRIYVFGSSNGGGGTWDLLTRFPTLFAAGIPMAGNGESSNAAAIAPYLKEIPIWTFHGDNDETLDVSGTRGIVDAIESIGGTKIIYTEVPEGTHNNIWTIAAGTEGLVEWMFAQKIDDENGTSDRINLTVDEFLVENPVNDGMLRIHVPYNAEITLYTLSGQKIMTQKLGEGVHVLNMKNVSAGSYFLRMKINNQIYSKKILKYN
ncbi:hypothetical protein MASR2M117_15460 [Paludibacter sp.]